MVVIYTRTGSLGNITVHRPKLIQGSSWEVIFRQPRLNQKFFGNHFHPYSFLRPMSLLHEYKNTKTQSEMYLNLAQPHPNFPWSEPILKSTSPRPIDGTLFSIVRSGF